MAGGQRKARREVKGKGRMKSRERSQADRAKASKRWGTSKAGGAGTLGACGGGRPCGLHGEEGPTGKRREPGWVRQVGEQEEGQARAQRGGLQKSGWSRLGAAGGAGVGEGCQAIVGLLFLYLCQWAE